MFGPKLFQEATTEEKINFFLKCQELLTSYHPESEFIWRQNNAQERIAHVKTLTSKYKGYVYSDEFICVLFNKIVIADPNDTIKALQDNLYKEPNPNYNAASIDFVVFRDIKDCLNFTQKNYEARMQYMLFVKNNNPKIYPTTNFMARILNIPIIS